MTGVGSICSAGRGPAALWDLVTSDTDGHVESRVAHVDFPDRFTEKQQRRLARFAQFGVVAGLDAVEQANATAVDPEWAAVVVGTGLGGTAELIDAALGVERRTTRVVNPLLIPSALHTAAASTLSMRLGWFGPCETVSAACATGTVAIGRAMRLIQNREAKVVVAGGADGGDATVLGKALQRMQVTSKKGAVRPFDVARDGFVASEGAAALVLEDAEHATARGVQILGELLGFASTSDAYSIGAPAPEGTGAARCISRALLDAGIDASAIQHVNCHGSATELNDLAEAAAINSLFGTDVPITSVKGNLGHCGGAAGALEALCVLLAFQHTALPVTSGHHTFDPGLASVNVVAAASADARCWTPGVSVSNSLGLGGHNAALVVAPYHG